MIEGAKYCDHYHAPAPPVLGADSGAPSGTVARADWHSAGVRVYGHWAFRQDFGNEPDAPALSADACSTDLAYRSFRVAGRNRNSHPALSRYPGLELRV